MSRLCLLSTLVLVALLTACVPQKQWRTKPFYEGTTPNAKVEERFVIPNDPAAKRLYSFAFVEFQNNGQAYDPRQLTEALRAIDDADRRSNHRAIVVTFIHGWKNNAKETNNNVLDFRRQLNRIAADACLGDSEHCGVIGVYLAWSGDLVSRYANTTRGLTYYDRRNVAIQVGSAQIANALFAVMKSAKEGVERQTNLSIVVGHSFGGLVLEDSISQRMKLVGDELRAELGKGTTTDEVRLKTLDGFADLIVLINQAAPAVTAARLLGEYRQDLQKVNLLRPPREHNCSAPNPPQDCKPLTRPLILSVSSETDLATRAVLPVAETLLAPPNRPPLPPDSQLPKELQGSNAKKLYTFAAAHTSALYSHNMILCENKDCSPCLDEKKGGDKFYIPVSITLPAYAPGNDTHADKQLEYCVVRDFKAWNRTPYWIFHIPPEVVPDHGTIFTDRFTDFLSSFLPPLAQYRSMQRVPAPTRQLRRAQ